MVFWCGMQLNPKPKGDSVLLQLRVRAVGSLQIKGFVLAQPSKMVGNVVGGVFHAYSSAVVSYRWECLRSQ